jgi:predicted transcriptional regulator
MYSLYVRQKVQKGVKDFEEGRVVSHEDLKKKLLHL